MGLNPENRGYCLGDLARLNPVASGGWYLRADPHPGFFAFLLSTRRPLSLAGRGARLVSRWIPPFGFRPCAAVYGRVTFPGRKRGDGGEPLAADFRNGGFWELLLLRGRLFRVDQAFAG